MTNILSIPIRSACEDAIAWHFNLKGTFSVRSAYHVLEDNQELSRCSQRGESSISENDGNANMVWKKLWKLNWPPKIKKFYGEWDIIVWQ